MNMDLDLRHPAWKQLRSGSTILHFRGYIHSPGIDDLADRFDRLSRSTDPSDDSFPIDEIDGHFALVAETPDWTLVSVDPIRSIPLCFARDGARWRVGDQPGHVARTLDLGLSDMDPIAALSIAMAGYTIGDDALYRPLNVLKAGTAALLRPSGDKSVWSYQTYAPWEVEDRSFDRALSELRERTLRLLQKMVASVGGRTIVVPLSGGLDSRLIVAGLKHLGVENVKCFSYGIPGNREAKRARRVAETLGYEWRFVPYKVRSHRQWYATDDHRTYLEFADCCTATPFEQDLPALRCLQDQGWLGEDSVVANGQTGDFISGDHIHSVLHRPLVDLSPEEREGVVVRSLLDRHFRLWRSLGTPRNDGRILARLRRELRPFHDAFADPLTTHGAYEFSEFQGRQTKYVVNGVRAYDYLGLDWRLPLWDREYLDFWSQMPLEFKVDQKLYRDMLVSENWGGVWKDPEFWLRMRVVPTWLWIARGAVRALARTVVDEDCWRAIDARVFRYWTGNLRGQAFLPYWRVLRDERGARNMVSWWTEVYLQRKGLRYDANPLTDG